MGTDPWTRGGPNPFERPKVPSPEPKVYFLEVRGNGSAVVQKVEFGDDLLEEVELMTQREVEAAFDAHTQTRIDRRR